ncbi:MAG: hypothetical protein HEEMFOPI_01317 [Holosporales bacterium]
MNKKIILCALFGMSIAQAKFYAGVKTTLGIPRNNHETHNVIDTIREKCERPDIDVDQALAMPVEELDALNAAYAPVYRPVNISNHHVRFKSKSVNFGLLLGYAYEDLHKSLIPFFEIDVDLKSQKNRVDGINFLKNEDGQSTTNCLNNESYQVRSGVSFGVTLGVETPITKTLSGLIGARVHVTPYTVTAQHNANDESVLPASSITKSEHLFGVEPTIGLKYAFDEKMAARFTVGYNIGQTKTIIKNYIVDVPNNSRIHKKTGAGFTLKPRSLNFTFTLLYTY